ncbi:glycosyltransferase family 61 protein [Synechococcus sp. BS55D]|uniref:glycosyltransferase family 61 protein n=1 Tax=Synechococcus sp. BS55D TaxID=2055943 RepID=UPI001F25BFA4|nr:glycosyltransferase family 61 protein [Synechococcus sp. BS55D]
MVVGCLTDNCHALYDTTQLAWITEQLVHYKGTLWSETALIDNLLRQQLRDLTQTISRNNKRSLLCTDQQGCNYYHFLIDILPKIITLHNRAKDSNFDYEEIILSDLPQYGLELLELSNIKRCTIKTVRRMGPGHAYTFAANHPLLHKQHRPAISDKERISLIKQSLRVPNQCRTNQKQKPKRIYIERRTSENRCNNRHVLPQSAFHHFLKNFGFSIIYPEDLSVSEQIRAFRSADVVAGVHGAGLSNLIWMQAGAKIIEIQHERGSHRYFANLAKAAGLDYQTIALEGYLSEEIENKLFHPELLFNQCPLKFDQNRLSLLDC